MKRFLVGAGVAISLLSGVYAADAAEVLMVTWGGKFSSEEGFEKRLKELRPDVKFTYIDSERKMSTLAQKLRELDVNKYDLVYSFGTTGSKIVKQYLNGKKPQVFNIVSVPVLSEIADSMEKPGNNVTGAGLLVKMETQLEIMNKLRDYKTLGVFFDPREKQNTAVLSEINKIAEAQGKKVVPIRIVPDAGNFDEMLNEATAQANKLDALYFIASSSFAPHYKKLHSKLDPKLLVMGSISVYVEAGSTVALGADFTERGQSAAELANKILGGANAGEIPVDQVSLQKAFLYVNKNRMASVGLKDLDKLGVKIQYMEEKTDPGKSLERK